ncbi:hypothetical protein COOONC_03786 [Cooperia oncophora]
MAPHNMKVDPDGLLASLIASPILLTPFASIETQLERKATYVQSRLARLREYEDIASAGLPLTVSQNEARSKIDEVMKHLQYVKALETMQSPRRRYPLPFTG